MKSQYENDPDLKYDCKIAMTKIKALLGALEHLPIFCIFPKYVCGLIFSEETIQVYYYDGKINNPYVR